MARSVETKKGGKEKDSTQRKAGGGAEGAEKTMKNLKFEISDGFGANLPGVRGNGIWSWRLMIACTGRDGDCDPLAC
jgi:hypothetical protein